MEKNNNLEKKREFNYVKVIVIISIILTLNYIVVIVFFWSYVFSLIPLSLLTGFIPFWIALSIMFRIVKIFYKPLSGEVFIKAVLLSVFFCFITFKIYHLMTRTPIGVRILFPIKTGEIKEHFAEKYEVEITVDEMTYYLEEGRGWYRSVSGHTVEDPETTIDIWGIKGRILDNYSSILFQKEVKAYYEDILEEIIPWEFRLEIYIRPYRNSYEKSYREYLREEDFEVINEMKFYIRSPGEVLEIYGKEKYREVYLKVVKDIYAKNQHLNDVYISFALLSLSIDEIINLSEDEFFNSNKKEPYVLGISINDLNKSFFQVDNFEEFEEYMKKRNKKEVERWIEN